MTLLGATVSWALVAQLTVGGLVLGSTYALLGLSFGIIYSTTEIFHFAHSAVYAAAAYAAVVLLDDVGVPWPLAILLAILTAGLLGILIEVFGYRPLRKSGAPQLVVFLVSLGLATLAPNVLQIIFGPGNRTFGSYSPYVYSVGSVTITTLEVATIIVNWVLIAAVLIFLARTKQGLAVKAVRVNKQMAWAVGISANRIHLLVFGIGSMLVSVAALFFLANGVANPTMGLSPILYALIAVFVGGVGSMVGAALGGFMLGMLTSLSALWLSSEYQLVFVFAVLFVFVIIRPAGLLGKVVR